MTLIEGTKTFPKQGTKSEGQKPRYHTGTVGHYQQERRRRGEEEGRGMVEDDGECLK